MAQGEGFEVGVGMGRNSGGTGVQKESSTLDIPGRFCLGMDFEAAGAAALPIQAWGTWGGVWIGAK